MFKAFTYFIGIPLAFSPFVLCDMNSQREEVTALVIGKAGSGKSFLGNLILGDHLFTESATPQGRTKISQKESRQVRLEDKIYQLTLIDTVGLFDENIKSKVILDEIVNKMNILLRVNKIILVYEYSQRIESYTSSILLSLKYVMGSSLSSNLLLVINKIDDKDPLDDQQKNNNNVKVLVEKNLTSGFDCLTIPHLNVNQLNDETVKQKYQKQLLQKILNKCQEPFERSQLEKWDSYYSKYQKQQQFIFNRKMQNEIDDHTKQTQYIKNQIESHKFFENIGYGVSIGVGYLIGDYSGLIVSSVLSGLIKLSSSSGCLINQLDNHQNEIQWREQKQQNRYYEKIEKIEKLNDFLKQY